MTALRNPRRVLDADFPGALPRAGHRAPSYDDLAPFYDDLLGRAGFDHVWAAFRRALRRFRIEFSSLADLGCGTGLFLDVVAQHWPEARLIGVDRSASMLAQAGHRLAGLGVELTQGDMQHIHLRKAVNIITCNYSTINYLTNEAELKKMFSSHHENIVIGGYLIFDMLRSGGIETPPIIQSIKLPTFSARWVITAFPSNQGSRVVMHNRRRQGQGWHSWTEVHVQRWWPIGHIVRTLTAAGLTPVAVSPMIPTSQPHPARWVQVVARRE
jgi:SAM-dependent methyltransferase